MAISIKDLIPFCEEVNDLTPEQQQKGFIKHLRIPPNFDYRQLLRSENPNTIINENAFSKKDIVAQPELKDFNFKGLKDFIPAGKLSLNPLEILINKDEKQNVVIQEKVSLNDYASEEAKTKWNTYLGACYILTAVVDGKEHFIKVGQTRKTMSERAGSYSTGSLKYIGKNSTTNLRILQSMVNADPDVEFRMHIWYNPDRHSGRISLYDEISSPLADGTQLAMEEITIKKFVQQFGFKPLGNVQMDPQTECLNKSKSSTKTKKPKRNGDPSDGNGDSGTPPPPLNLYYPSFPNLPVIEDSEKDKDKDNEDDYPCECEL